MTFTNHLMTGAAIAKFLPLPIALPLAFASHFVLDSLPHMGLHDVPKRHQVTVFRAIMLVDFSIGTAFCIWLIQNTHPAWLLSGVVAFSPDFVWIYKYLYKEKLGTLPPGPRGRFSTFHKNIQKYERFWALSIEVVYGLGLWFFIFN